MILYGLTPGDNDQHKTMKILKFLVLTLIVLLGLTAVILYEGDIPKDVVDARYSSPASQFMNLGDSGLIHYRDEGNRRGDTIVLLHGSNASLHTWEPWVSSLSNDYRVLSLDLPGHGLTGAVPTGDYSTEAYMSVVKSVTESLGIDQFVLAGNSMGGGVAWRYALEYPDQLTGLVLIDSSGLPEWYQQNNDDDGGGSVMIFRLMRQDWFRAISRHLDPYYLTAQGVRAAYNNSPVVDDELIMRYYELNLREGTREATMTRFGQSWSNTSYSLDEIKVPTLVMWGRVDSLTPFEHAAKFETAIPNTTTAYYDEVGHIPMEEIPEQSANDLISFLETINTMEETVGESE